MITFNLFFWRVILWKTLKGYDNIVCCLAASIFTDEHHGAALYTDEFEYLMKLKNSYSEVIEEAVKKIATDSSFENLSHQEKIVYCIELFKNLSSRIKVNLVDDLESNQQTDVEQFVDINDYLDTIPQEDDRLELNDNNVVRKR